MGTKPISEIMGEIKQSYEEFVDSQGDWRVFGNKGDRGKKDLFFYNPKAGIWQLKGDHKSPHEFIGAGGRTKPRNVKEEIKETIEREGEPLPFGIASPHPDQEKASIIAGGMGRYSGSSDPLREVMTKRQKELDKKLKKKVDSLMERHGVNKEYY